MKNLTKISFNFEDGSSIEINDPRAALLFQSRCNSAGILVGLEDYLIDSEDKDNINVSDNK